MSALKNVDTMRPNRAWFVSQMILAKAAIMVKILRDKYMFVCLLVGTVLLYEFGIASTVVVNIKNSVATTLLSVGIIGLIYDYMMRKQIQNEMIRLVGIQSSIISNKVEGVGSQEDMSWDDFFNSGTYFKFLLSDAEGWVRENWKKIEERAKEVPIQVEIYIPDPQADYMPALSMRNGHTEERLPRACEELKDTLETLWKAMAKSARTRNGAKISIFHLESIPSYSLVSSESVTHLLLGPPMSKNIARQPFRLSFRASHEVEPVANFHYKINADESNKLVYANLVKK